MSERPVIFLHVEKRQLPQKVNYLFAYSVALFLMTLGLLTDPLPEVLAGFGRILTSPSQLFTDFIALGNLGSACFNSGLLMLISILLIQRQHVHLTGPLYAGIFTVAGYSFFGKNLYNSIPIMLGVYLYARYMKKPFAHYLLVSLFGSALSPVVSFITFGLGLPLAWGVALGYLAGILIGACLPLLAAQFLHFHQGFTLYNVGFTSGIIAMFFTGFIRMCSVEVTNQNIISSDAHEFLLVLSLCAFFGMLLLGLALMFKLRTPWRNLQTILNSSGKLMTDFVVIAGLGPTLVNMALMGFLLLGYVLVVQGTLSGPVIGALLSAVGFSAFGNHIKNSLPVLIGVFLVSTFTSFHDVNQTGVLVAAIFATSLAPISGYYGSIYGVIAGVLHMTLVFNVGYLHGGLNLYNNGFSSGFVAGFLVPLLDNFTQVGREKRIRGKRDLKENRG
ncbi:hypothetical protein RU97_GL002398 [Enterococcus canis]|jgi:Protein of unknown function (DUF1576).|uniref:DUF1576 domain-containing protein n=1 Tax=Enterococcus canis TaxID=214095 RepID=A0A1L8RDT9_9ENTE|nr:DUF1576 domain-containing protein [Enterococcus canis]OJG17852.1 hypothetical protein RU97_GL002398 [Enterococcus canis]